MWKPIDQMPKATPEQLAAYFGGDNATNRMIEDGFVCFVMGRNETEIIAYPEPAYFDANGQLFSIIDGYDLETSVYNLFMPI